ncbi:MAG: RloB domain-containing protein [Deltaproteobacteria bacterium]|nr:RloB domain-containing protein [Deltaproteobacteria bacterium]
MVSRGRLKDRRGKRNKRQASPVVLFVCEGKETEQNYLKGFQRAHRIQSERFLIHGPEKSNHTDPAGIVSHARTQNARAATRARGYALDAIFCVFDRDRHDSFDEASRNAKKHGLELARSVPCFELWLLLHFKDQHAHIEGGQVQSELKAPECLPSYAKNMTGLFEFLKEHEAIATTRAEGLREEHLRASRSVSSNPSTEIDQLLARLRELFDVSEKDPEDSLA